MWTLVLLLALTAAGSSASHIRYVKPENLSPADCPDQPCLSLDQYVEQNRSYFTDGSTFQFLDGNHTSQDIVSLSNIYNVTLRGGQNVNIICEIKVSMQFDNATNLRIEQLRFVLTTNQYEFAKALQVLSSTGVRIYNSVFLGSGNISHPSATGVHCTQSSVTVVNCYFEGITFSAVFAFDRSNLVLSGNTFIRNRSDYTGSAIGANTKSSILLIGNPKNEFLSNLAGYNGAAINCEGCTLEMTGYNYFKNNYLFGELSGGGAISIFKGKLIISGSAYFFNNTASEGGAIFLVYSTALLAGEEIEFNGNSAETGGAMSFRWSSVTTSPKCLLFIYNHAKNFGGALSIGTIEATTDYYANFSLVEISGTFVNNEAKCGGAIFAEKEMVMLRNISILENSGSALCIFDNNILFTGTTTISSNQGNSGGGISSRNSVLVFMDETFFDSNHATAGGAINSLQGEVTFHGATTFLNNTAEMDGGALYALGSHIILEDTAVEFISNTAQNGGAMYFRSEAALVLTFWTVLNTSSNRASLYGGAVYSVDSTTSTQCNFTASTSRTDEQFLSLPYCFLQSKGSFGIIYSHNDSAGKDGNFLYGGLLDKCRMNEIFFNDVFQQFTLYRKLTNHILKMNPPRNNKTNGLSSSAYELHFCDCISLFNCTRTKSIEVFRGQKFRVSLVAIAQGGVVISTLVTATTHNSRFNILQNSQTLPKSCSSLSYNMYSAQDHDEMTLSPDSPCGDSGLARLVVNVTLLPCPDGFTQSGERCICEKRLRLQEFNINCTIDESIEITRKTGSKVWISALYYPNGSYQGLVLYDACPSQYCTSETVSITLDNLDAQCAVNRSGVLCGECKSYYSLLLGSSRCAACSNLYLTLLIPFACAGMALVAFLTFLKLTVATGPINSLILYANIMQVNIRTFLPFNTVNTLTVFIAWLNLDLGFETCFYDGMNAYIQTCLQFVFPVYIWILISLIILTSRRSVIISRLIGSNPIAVLATLLLMSYTKMLRIIIEVYSSVKLDYPNNMQVPVWLKDANEPYLQSRHLFLTVLTSLLLVFLFLPYTLLLLLGHRFYRFSGRRGLRWLNRLKPLLDSYHAPYRPHTCYWTGLLLLVRCALYVVFSYNSLGGTGKSLLAIIVTFTAVGFLASGRIYKSLMMNVIELFVYFNLIVLSTATLTGLNSPTLVYSLVGTVLATFVGVATYQFHCLYIAKTSLWLRIKGAVTTLYLQKYKTKTPITEPPAGLMSYDPHKIVSKSVIHLREPLLED